MAIEFLTYFECITPCINEEFDRNISQFLPDLSVLAPAFSDATARSYGLTDYVYYNTTTTDLKIYNAYQLQVGPNTLAVGEDRYFFRMPVYADAEATSPLCYFGAKASCPSADTLALTMGFYQDQDLDTEYFLGSARSASLSLVTDFYYQVGVGYFIFPDRDDYFYPNPWDKMGFCLYYSSSFYDWTADYHQLGSGQPDTFGPHLYSNSGWGGNEFWVLDFGEYAINHQGAGLYQSYTGNYSPEVGPESEQEGYGQDGDTPTFDDTSDTIDLPTAPTLGVTNVGFVNVYKTGTNSLQQMGVELFPPLNYTPPTAIAASDTTEAIVNGFNQIVTFLANIPSFFDQMVANTLINYVIDCHVIPVTPSGGSSEYIKVGWKTLTTQASRLSADYVDVSCGSITISEYYAGFADFLTTAKLYLPFVGFVPVQPEWFQRETLKVDYRFNVIDGSFTVYVRAGGKYVNNGDTTGTIVGQYGGNACIHLPITGVTYASMVSGLVGAGAGMAAGAGTGNIAALATSAIGAAGAHGDIAQSNAYSSSAAFLGCRYPFLMIERPVSNYARNYQHEIGIPANIYAKLGDVPGFVKMENVHVDGISGATDVEKEEIRRLLSSGVIV